MILNILRKPDPLYALLVENNPYDRAVIDAALEADRDIRLAYTRRLKDSLVPIDLDTSAWKQFLPPGLARVVLLDLALRRSCANVLASGEVQSKLQEMEAALGRLGLQLVFRPYDELSDLIRASIAICDADRAEIGSRWEQELSSLNSELKSEVLRSALTPIFEELKGHSLSKDAIKTCLRSLWKSEESVEVVRLLSKARSLWSIFMCVATNPDLCFFIVSHYVNPTTADALIRLLACRHGFPSGDDTVYNQFIISKSALGNLAGTLRNGHKKWEELISPQPRFAPFLQLPVTTSEGDDLTLFNLVQSWKDSYISSRGEQLLLWDETECLAGAEGRWSTIVNNWPGIAPMTTDSLDGAPIDRHCVVLCKEHINGYSDAVLWANNAKNHLAHRANNKRFTVVIVSGSPDAFNGFIAAKPAVTWSRVRRFRAMDAEHIHELISSIPTHKPEEGQHCVFRTWQRPPNDETVHGGRMESLAGILDKMGGKVKDGVLARLRDWLPRQPDPSAWKELTQKIDQILPDLVLRNGKDWRKVLDDHGL